MVGGSIITWVELSSPLCYADAPPTDGQNSPLGFSLVHSADEEPESFAVGQKSHFNWRYTAGVLRNIPNCFFSGGDFFSERNSGLDQA